MNKGFTLVELLGVMIILTVLSLIITPVVITLIDEAEVGAELRSAELYINAVEHDLASSKLDGINVEDGEYFIMEDGNLCLGNLSNNICDANTFKINATGSRPKGGYIDVESKVVVGTILIYEEKNIIMEEKGIYSYIDVPTYTQNDTTYPWIISNKHYKSSNHNHNTTSNLTFEFELEKTAQLSFEWAVSGESCCDYIYYTIKKDGTTLSGTGTSTAIKDSGNGTSESSLVYKTVTKTLEPGTYQLIFTYRKDGSVHKGTDTGYVKNLVIKY